jgi:hypothetical protein
MRTWFPLALLLCCAQALTAQESRPATSRPAEPSPMLSQKIAMLYCNHAKDDQVQKVIELMEQAAKAGYTHVTMGDSKWLKWDRQDEAYVANVKKVREKARELGLVYVAGVAPLGYSNDILSKDVNLAEGLPVKDAPFIVKDGKLIPQPEEIVENGSFEQTKTTKDGLVVPLGWTIEVPGKIGFSDDKVVFEGKRSLRMQDFQANDKHMRGRLIQKLKTSPFRYYHVSLMMKTQDLDAKEIAISPLGANRLLNHERLVIKKTQDWTRYDICFNSLDNPEVNLYIGTWAGKTGTMWIDDVRVEPAGFVNVLRRDGTPVKLTSPDGKTVYTEGKDVAEIKDPNLGNDGLLGAYKSWHDVPVINIPAGSRLKEGDKVLASYYHPAVTVIGQVMVCMSEPKVMELIKWEFQQVHKYVQPDMYMISHDEIRVQGWDESCQQRKISCMEILADNVTQCIDALTKEDPGKPICMISDLFDPNHNAAKTGMFYLVRDENPWYGSWKAVPKDVIIYNWMHAADKRVASLKFFSERGNRQVLAGYYDMPITHISEWMKDAQGIEGIIGIQYCTWSNNYSDLGKFVEQARSTFTKQP